MILIKKANEHFHFKGEWLDSYWHFSFDHYHDPSNMGWKHLRVFNDDIINPHSGFPMHPHENMEIITYVLDGELTHRDNLGNHGIVHPGEIQWMSAGKGIIHSEYNAGNIPLRLVQMWVLPNQRGLDPAWKQERFSQNERTNTLLPVISSAIKENEKILPIYQDATLYISFLEKGKTLEHALRKDSHAYVFVLQGSILLNGQLLNTRDAARIRDEKILSFMGEEETELLIWEMG